jgi:basic membrane protein A and related proteins
VINFIALRNRLSVAALIVLVVGLFVLPGRAASGSKKLRVGLVLEEVAVGRGSDPFQHVAFVGLQRAVTELGVQGRAVAPSPTGSWTSAYSYLARQRYDLIIGVGLLEASAMDIVARRFPSTKFAILDAPREALTHRPKNVEGILFRTEQPSFLAGYLAARLEDRRPGRHTISSVGGVPIPTVDAFIAGYQAGARAADPNIVTLNAYSGDFLDQAKCARVARDQIARGSGVVFDVAGGCGLGALGVAKRRGVWGIGVDFDQSYLGRFMLTSVVKRLDVAVYHLVRSLKQGRLPIGKNMVFDFRNNGVGLGKFSPAVPRSLRVQLERLRVQIADGRIQVPTRVG